MYKDKDRQREANRQAKARQRAKQGMTSEGMTNEGMTGNMTIETLIKMDAGCGDKLTHGVTGIVAGYPDPVFTQLLAKADPAMCRPVSKPGDADYVPMCETTRNFRGNYAS